MFRKAADSVDRLFSFAALVHASSVALSVSLSACLPVSFSRPVYMPTCLSVFPKCNYLSLFSSGISKSHCESQMKLNWILNALPLSLRPPSCLHWQTAVIGKLQSCTEPFLFLHYRSDTRINRETWGPPAAVPDPAGPPQTYPDLSPFDKTLLHAANLCVNCEILF